MGGVVDSLIEKIENFVGRIFFMLERLVCLLIKWMQDLFRVFSGIDQAKVGEDGDYLVNIFFGNKVINSIYWGMAAIGIIMAFVFAIMAVIKKSADLDDKMRTSHSQILRSLLKSILIIMSMSLFMIITVTFTNVLMDSVNEVFDNGPTLLDNNTHITYDDEQFAAMSRVLNSVGNYSLNPSYNNRYNLNACYNEIRTDLKYLADTGVFDYYYSNEEDGKTKNTWQSALQELAVAADYTKEQPVDTYNEGIANALNHCMEILKSDYNFQALEHFDREKQYNQDDVRLDRILFLSGTMGIGNDAAARNEAYNKNPDMFDNIRGPYYIGTRDIYDSDQVNEDFYVSFTRMNYFVVYIAGIAIIVNLAVIIVNCIVRIFNLLFLYVIAPPIIASSPLDDGGKFKQWMTAFIVQAFSVFATVISMRIFLIFIPIVMNPDFKLVENNVVNAIGKLIMVWAGSIAIEKANGLLTGILADSAGWQSVMAGSSATDVKNSKVGRMASAAQNTFEGAVAAPVTGTVNKAWGIAKSTAGVAASIATLPVRPITGAISNAGKRISEAYSGFLDSASNSIVESPEHKKRQEAKNQQPGGGGGSSSNNNLSSANNSSRNNSNNNNSNNNNNGRDRNGNVLPPPMQGQGRAQGGGQGQGGGKQSRDDVLKNLFGVDQNYIDNMQQRRQNGGAGDARNNNNEVNNRNNNNNRNNAGGNIQPPPRGGAGAQAQKGAGVEKQDGRKFSDNEYKGVFGVDRNNAGGARGGDNVNRQDQQNIGGGNNRNNNNVNNVGGNAQAPRKGAGVEGQRGDNGAVGGGRGGDNINRQDQQNIGGGNNRNNNNVNNVGGNVQAPKKGAGVEGRKDAGNNDAFKGVFGVERNNAPGGQRQQNAGGVNNSNNDQRNERGDVQQPQQGGGVNHVNQNIENNTNIRQENKGEAEGGNAGGNIQPPPKRAEVKPNQGTGYAGRPGAAKGGAGAGREDDGILQQRFAGVSEADNADNEPEPQDGGNIQPPPKKDE